jgi:hypothetical protein
MLGFQTRIRFLVEVKYEEMGAELDTTEPWEKGKAKERAGQRARKGTVQTFLSLLPLFAIFLDGPLG